MNSQILAESLKIVRRRFKGGRPACGLILGTGWEAVVELFAVRKKISYELLPALGKTTVAGHAGLLLRAELCGMETLIFQGRRHWYEGLGWEPVALPVYILKKLGAAAVVLTNSAGGIRADFKPGAVMAIRDHINAMGTNPLHGKHDSCWGARFPDQTAVYDPRLRSLLKRAARRHDVRLQEGVYIGVAGPAYETPAEIRAFKTMGADAVGMSTVPEAILANAAGLRVAGLSLIANPAAGLGPGGKLAHEDVRAAGQRAKENIKTLLLEFWRMMAREKPGLRQA
ncbi:MAG: purine-nucleoside phosphorylase [Kiritimatiellae bacterium]|nr:purine-nucleoside phosphorylase [Kiritimatiellia bacterium]